MRDLHWWDLGAGLSKETNHREEHNLYMHGLQGREPEGSNPKRNVGNCPKMSCSIPVGTIIA